MRYIYLAILLTYSISGLSQIKISKAKNLDLTSYKTFAVQKGQIISLLKEKEISEDSIFKTLQRIINYEMTLRGFELSTDSSAQLVISYVFEEAEESLSQRSGPLGGTPTQDPSGIDQTIQPISIRRALIIEIEDAKAHNPLWTATCVMERAQSNVYAAIEQVTVAAFRKLKKVKK
jgi:hypothetical protein